MTLAPLAPDTTALAPDQVGTAVDSIVRWASNLSTAAQAIRMIVDTPFMPLSFWPSPRVNGALVGMRDWPTPNLQHPRETPEEYAARREICISSGAIAVTKGDEIGLTPTTALDSIYVVRGKPGMYAETMEALVTSRGHEFIREELTDRICRIRTRRKGSDQWQRFEFTMERARKAGYTRQNPKYDADPQTMLWARCRAEASRGTDPAALKGLKAIEEIEDDSDTLVPRAATRTIQRAQRAELTVAPAAPASLPQQTAPAPAGPPLPDEEQQPAEAAEPSRPAPLDQRAWRAIQARLNELGVVGEGQMARRRQVMCHIVGRSIGSPDDLTAADGQTILDKLAGEAGERLTRAVLDPDPQADMGEPKAAPAGPPLPGEGEPEDDSADGADDTDSDTDYDPTVDQDWPGDTP